MHDEGVDGRSHVNVSAEVKIGTPPRLHEPDAELSETRTKVLWEILIEHVDDVVKEAQRRREQDDVVAWNAKSCFANGRVVFWNERDRYFGQRGVVIGPSTYYDRPTVTVCRLPHVARMFTNIKYQTTFLRH